jgi:hypothetical protein
VRGLRYLPFDLKHDNGGWHSLWTFKGVRGGTVRSSECSAIVSSVGRPESDMRVG